MNTQAGIERTPRGAAEIEPFVRPSSVTISPNATLRAAARAMHLHEVPAVAVLDDGLPVGLISERDVARALAAGADPDAAQVTAWMTTPATTAHRSDGVIEAAIVMLRNEVRSLPVLGPATQRVGLVRLDDILLPLLLAAEPPSERLPYMPPD